MKIVFNGYFYKNEKLKVTQAVKIFSENFKISKNFHFTVHSLNESESKKLNQKTFNTNKPTDVLSFPFNEKIKKNSFLGDVVISYEIVKKRSYSSSFSRELDKIWVHGLLHLLGYNHKKLKDYSKMYNKEKIILKKLEIIN